MPDLALNHIAANATSNRYVGNAPISPAWSAQDAHNWIYNTANVPTGERAQWAVKPLETVEA